MNADCGPELARRQRQEQEDILSSPLRQLSMTGKTMSSRSGPTALESRIDDSDADRGRVEAIGVRAVAIAAIGPSLDESEPCRRPGRRSLAARRDAGRPLTLARNELDRQTD